MYIMTAMVSARKNVTNTVSALFRDFQHRNGQRGCCHVAVGEGFQEVIEGAENMTLDEIHARGVNDSIIHVDSMIGSDDLDITGICEDGTEIPVFRNGTWA